MSITRLYGFSATHRMENPVFSPSENRRIFGKDVRLHGHDYGLEVTVEGPLDPRTGRVVDPRRLDEIVRRFVLAPMDHGDMKGVLPLPPPALPSGENIARGVWKILEGCVALAGTRLAHVGVRETRRNRFDDFGPDPRGRGERLA